jgi:hypothetical protein
MSTDEFREFLSETLGAAALMSRDGAVHFVCMDWRHLDDVSAAVEDIYGDLLNICVWNKSNAGMGSLYRSKHELVLVYRVGTAPTSTQSSWANTDAIARMFGITRRSTPWREVGERISRYIRRSSPSHSLPKHSRT